MAPAAQMVATGVQPCFGCRGRVPGHAQSNGAVIRSLSQSHISSGRALCVSLLAGTHVKKLVGASDLSQFFRALEQQQQPDAVETQQSTQLPASQPAPQQQQPGQQRQHKAQKQQQQDSTCSKDRLPPRSRL